jgi:hypothetical protein
MNSPAKLLGVSSLLLAWACSSSNDTGASAADAGGPTHDAASRDASMREGASPTSDADGERVITHGKPFIITGSGFGTKPMSAPLVADVGASSDLATFWPGGATNLTPYGQNPYTAIQYRPVPFTRSKNPADYTYSGSTVTTFVSGATYSLGDTILVNDHLYTCIQAGAAGTDPSVFNGTSTVNGAPINSLTTTFQAGATSIVVSTATGLEPGMEVLSDQGGIARNTLIAASYAGGPTVPITLPTTGASSTFGDGTNYCNFQFNHAVVSGATLWKYTPDQTIPVTSTNLRAKQIIGGCAMGYAANYTYDQGMTVDYPKPQTSLTSGVDQPHTVYVRYKTRIDQSWDYLGWSSTTDANWKFLWLAEGTAFLGASGSPVYYWSGKGPGSGPLGSNDEDNGSGRMGFNDTTRAVAYNGTLAAGTGFYAGGAPNLYGDASAPPSVDGTGWTTQEFWFRMEDTGNSHMFYSPNNNQYLTGTSSNATSDFSYVTSSSVASITFGSYHRATAMSSNWIYYDEPYAEVVEAGATEASGVWFLTDNPSWMASKKFALQPWISWSDSSVTIFCQGSEIPSGSQVYLHLRRPPWRNPSDAAYAGPYLLKG